MDTSFWGREIALEILRFRSQPECQFVFPKLVMPIRKEVNRYPGSPNYDIYMKALKMSSEKLYPDYLSLDGGIRKEIYDRSGEILVPMGCRAYLSPFVDPETGKEIYTGRGNLGAVSLNLVKYAIESEGDWDKFYEMIETYSNMVWDIQNWRYERVGQTTGSVNPLLWTSGATWKSVAPHEKIAPILEGFTASVGYVGMNETLNFMYQANGTVKLGYAPGGQRQKDQIRILEKINEVKEKRIKTDGRMYATYSTPAESLVYTMMSKLKSQYGEIKDVTDREYLTNSFHVPVWEHTDALTKMSFEAPFHELAAGGHITYNEFSFGVPITTLEACVNHAMDLGLYYGVNVVSGYCHACGNRGDFIEECASCGGHDVSSIQRTCGYLTHAIKHGNVSVNPGKWVEIHERVDHNVTGDEDTRSFKEKGIHGTTHTTM